MRFGLYQVLAPFSETVASIQINGADADGNDLAPLITPAATLALAGGGSLIIDGVDNRFTSVWQNAITAHGGASIGINNVSLELLECLMREAGSVFSGNGNVVSFGGAIINDGVVTSSFPFNGPSGLTFDSDVIGSGAFQIVNGSLLEFGQAPDAFAEVDSARVINFGPATTDPSSAEVLFINAKDVSNVFNATINDFSVNDSIVLRQIHATSARLSAVTAGLLEVYDDVAGEVVAALQLDAGDYALGSAATFTVASDFGASAIWLGGLGGTPVVFVSGDAAGAVTENATAAAVETESGILAFSDDNGNIDGPFVQAYPAKGQMLGTLTATLNTATDIVFWSYFVANNAINYLSEGQTKIETFTIEVSDFYQTTIKNVSVTITGDNYGPIILGDASNDSGGFYTLTEDVESEAGAIWGAVDLSSDAAWHARLFFGAGGANDNVGNGDGIAFAFQNTGTSAIGDGGNDLAIGNGIPEAFGVKFDTFKFGGETSA